MDEIELNICTTSGLSLSVSIDPHQTVYNVKETITKITKIPEKQQQLIFAGKILDDDLSISYYRVNSMSKIYLVRLKLKESAKPKPKAAIKLLKQLTAQIRCSKHEKSRKISYQIRDIISNSAVLSFASISSDAFQAIEDAQSALDEFDAIYDTSVIKCMASAADNSFNQVEASSDGLRILSRFLDEEYKNEDNKSGKMHKTVIPETPESVCESPLPTLFFANKNIYANYSKPCGDSGLWLEANSLPNWKHKYARQVDIIKKMGFEDEQNIIQALGETNGNVQLALERLQNCSLN